MCPVWHPMASFPQHLLRSRTTHYYLMLHCDKVFATIRENPIRVIPERKDAMNTQADIKMTDQLERDLIEPELVTQTRGFANDVKRARAAVKNVFTRLQVEARKAKVAYANG